LQEQQQDSNQKAAEELQRAGRTETTGNRGIRDKSCKELKIENCALLLEEFQRAVKP
jgi:hypothetical protein